MFVAKIVTSSMAVGICEGAPKTTDSVTSKVIQNGSDMSHKQIAHLPSVCYKTVFLLRP